MELLRKSQWAFLFVILIGSLAVQGCDEQTTIDSAYKTLGSAGIFYQASSQIAQEAYEKKLLTDAEADKLNHYAEQFHDVYHTAVGLLATYIENKDETTMTRLIVAFKELRTLERVIRDLVSKFGFYLPEVAY